MLCYVIQAAGTPTRRTATPRASGRRSLGGWPTPTTATTTITTNNNSDNSNNNNHINTTTTTNNHNNNNNNNNTNTNTNTNDIDDQAGLHLRPQRAADGRGHGANMI